MPIKQTNSFQYMNLTKQCILVGSHISCNYCSKSFSQPRQLQIHQRTYTREMPYKCKYFTRYTRKFTLERSSIIAVTGTRFFSHLGQLVHQRIHTGEKPQTCDYCNKTFSDLRPLKLHLIIHTGQNPYNCSYFQQGSQS